MSYIAKRNKNNWQRLQLNITETASWMSTKTNALLRKHKITYKQFLVLDIISASELGMTQKEIDSEMPDSGSDISRVVARIRSNGWIKRKRVKDDKRAFRLSLSKRGERKWLDVSDEIKAITALYKGLDKKEIKQLNNLLDQLRKG